MDLLDLSYLLHNLLMSQFLINGIHWHFILQSGNYNNDFGCVICVVSFAAVKWRGICGPAIRCMPSESRIELVPNRRQHRGPEFSCLPTLRTRPSATPTCMHTSNLSSLQGREPQFDGSGLFSCLRLVNAPSACYLLIGVACCEGFTAT